MIGLIDLEKNYENIKIHINTEIENGEIFGLIGESGSGKTTILKMIQGLIKPTSGKIELPEDAKLATIFQDFNLLNNITVYDNVALPLKLKGIKDKEKVLEALNFVGILDKKDKYISSLSGGQKQRVSIARALCSHSNILLCDEPTASLDENTSKEIVQLFLKINEKYKTTIILVTHELEIAKIMCDRVALIEKGKVLDIIKINKKDIKVTDKTYYEFAKEVLK